MTSLLRRTAARTALVALLVSLAGAALGAGAATAAAGGNGNGNGQSAGGGQSNNANPGSSHGQNNSPSGAATPTAGGQSGTGSVSKAGNAPPGNNGHIQIEELNGTAPDNEKGNDPHVSCAGFIVEFFGYDGGTQSAIIIVTPWAPTSGGHPVSIAVPSWNVVTRTGGDQLDTSYEITQADLASAFTGVGAAAQGYHARIEVEVTGSQGSDDKFHMVWIGTCPLITVAAGATPAATPTSSGSTTSGSSSAGTVTGAPAVAATTTALTRPSLVLGAASALTFTPETAARRLSSGSAPRTTSALAFTGADIAAMVMLGLAALGAGGGTLRLRRRRVHLAGQ